MYKNSYRLFMPLIISAAMLFETGASACTGVYIGSGVSADGSTMLARTEDVVSANNKLYIVHEARDHADGEMYIDDNGFSVPYPRHTYRYTAVADSPERELGDAPYGEAGFNEYGLAATSTITAYPNDAALKADPFVENGLCEISVNDIILSQSKTAREAMELIASLIDKYGSGEGSIIMAADQNEAWYMEILSGHQYAAMKMPSDMAAVIANNYMLETISLNSKDVIVSENLVSLARENGFLNERNGTINIKKTYSIDIKDSSLIRIWGGRKFLSPSLSGTPDADNYSLFFKPDHKISLEEVFEVQKYRYEDTEYSADIKGNEDIRVIGTSRQQECHVLQIRHDKPVDLAGIEWLCMGNAEFSVFVPSYASLITDTADIYKNSDLNYNEDSAYWTFRGLSALCAFDRERFGKSVRSYWKDYQKLLINKIPEMDNRLLTLKKDGPSYAQASVNSYAAMAAEDAFLNAKELRNGLMTFIAAFEGKKEAGDDLTGLSFTPQKRPELIMPLFSDISRREWYTGYIDYCVKKGYIEGIENGKFAPEVHMTRGQYLAALYRIFFKDNKSWTEAGDYILNLTGTQWTARERDQTVTRGEVADMCYKVLNAQGIQPKAVNERKLFSDTVDIDQDMAASIQYLQMAGVIDGYGNGRFGPDDPLRRADITAIIYNLSNVLE